MSLADSNMDTADLRSWIGREQRRSDSLDVFPARALAAVLDHPQLPEAGDLLPPSWHWLYFLGTPRSVGTGSDGHPEKGEFLPPIPLPRRMWAAGSLAITQPLRLGEPAQKSSAIRSIEHKNGKSGELVFIRIEHQLRQCDVLCISEEQTLVYRAMPATPEPLPAGERATIAADWSRELHPDPVLLFRFSALTYNSHRIHYDRDYATHKEFYPGLVMHAPLLATLLLDLAIQKGLARFKSIEFRAVRPTFDRGIVHLRGKRTNRQVSLWSEDHENYIGMKVTGTLDDPPP